MLRLHDFQCPKCEAVREELVDVPPQMAHIRCHCGAHMNHVIIGGKSHVFRPFMHPHLGPRPIEIRSWRQYKEELRKCGGANELAT